jgi:hypothetical protein
VFIYSFRDEGNAVAIITKHQRGNDSESWFQDTDDDQAMSYINTGIAELETKIRTGDYKRVMLPEDLGHAGELHIRAPKTFIYLLGQIYELAELYDPESLSEDLGEWLRYQASIAGKIKKRTAR